MKEKKAWSFVSLFTLALVISVCLFVLVDQWYAFLPVTIVLVVKALGTVWAVIKIVVSAVVLVVIAVIRLVSREAIVIIDEYQAAKGK